MSSPLAEVGEGGRTCCRDGQGGLGAACPRGSVRWGKLCGPRHLLRASVFGGLGASEAPALCVCGVLGPFAPVTRSLLFCQREVRAAARRSQTGSRCSPALHHRGCIDWGMGGGSVRAGPDPPKPGCPPGWLEERMGAATAPVGRRPGNLERSGPRSSLGRGTGPPPPLWFGSNGSRPRS